MNTLINLFLATLLFLAAAQGHSLAPRAGPCLDPEQYKDIKPPVMNVGLSGFNSPNILSVFIDSAQINTRTDLRFSLGSCAALPAIKTMAAVCLQRYEIAMNFSAWKACGMLLASSPNWDVYTGLISIQYDERAGVIAGQTFYRTVTNKMMIEVALQKTVWARADIVRIYAPPNVDLALLDVTVQYAGALVDFIVISGVQNPFQLDLFNVNPLPPMQIDWFTWSPSPIWNQSAGGAFRQKWLAHLDPRRCGCQLYGQQVNLNFTVACQPGLDPLLCPITSPIKVGMTVSLFTSDWCAKLVATVLLHATLDSYTDITYSVPTNAYFLGKPAYFKGELTPDDGLVIASSTVLSVVCDGASAVNTPPLIISAIAGRVTYDLSDPYHPKFWFLLDPALFHSPPGGFGTLTVWAQFQVTYAARKRSGFEALAEPQIVEISHEFQIADLGGVKASASSLTPWGFLL